MSYLPFLKLSAVAILAVASPGPDMLVVARSSLIHGRTCGVATAVGLATGILIHCTYCILGLALFLAGSPRAQHTLQIAGAAYLAYIGVQCLRSGAGLSEEAFKPAAAVQSQSLSAAFGQGLTTNLLNPKATLFILSVFSQVVSPRSGPTLQAMFAANLVGLTLLWFIALAYAIAWPPVRAYLLRWQKGIDRLFGLVLLSVAGVVFLTAIR